MNYAKLFGVKVYAAVNTLIKNGELDDFFACVAEALSAGVDAIILQDMFLGKTLKKMFPEIVLHLSTQAGVCNMLGARLAAEYGFSRVILARETRFEDIEKIAAFIETEVFVQGALCSSFFRPLLYEFFYRRKQRQPRALQAAVPKKICIYDGRQNAERMLCAFSFRSFDRERYR